MKEQMHEILMNLNRGRIAVSEAQEQLLDLFGVSNQGERFCHCSNGRNLFQRDGKYYCEQCFGLWQQNRC